MIYDDRATEKYAIFTRFPDGSSHENVYPRSEDYNNNTRIACTQDAFLRVHAAAMFGHNNAHVIRV